MIPKLCDIHEEVMMDVGSKETEGVLASVKSECIRKESEKGVCEWEGLRGCIQAGRGGGVG